VRLVGELLLLQLAEGGDDGDWVEPERGPVCSTACKPALCSGVFAQQNGPLHVTFGSTKARGTFVTLWTAPRGDR
jgi:hypothetical protein